MGDEVAEQGAVGEAAGEHVGHQSGVTWGGVPERREQCAEPVAPGPGGELEEDLLAGLEVAQQGRLMDADPVRDVGEAHRTHAVAQREIAGGAEDGVLALLLLLGAAGPLVCLRCHGTLDLT